MSFQFNIPQTDDTILQISVEVGASVIFVGANGGGKTRLAAHIERQGGEAAHRVAAHRALSLNPAVAKVSESMARRGLKYGNNSENANLTFREGHRWGSKAETKLLNDFDLLLQILFAEQTNIALETHNKAHAKSGQKPEFTKFQKLQSIWEILLPHRTLVITGDDIQVKAAGETGSYSAADMSDGERAIFYLIGQTLVAEQNSLLIIDEPELHVHKSIIGDLWDELEAARSDCGFIYITHDIDFAASRDAIKYSIQAYTSKPTWEITEVPEDTGFSEELTTLILGSRRPVLFVEGDAGSLDTSLYRHCFPDRLIIPRGSCDQVIHSVASMRQNADLTRIDCAGLIDADDRSADDIQRLARRGIFVLAVSEIENLLLLPDVSKEIAICNGYSEQEAATKVAELGNSIVEFVKADQNILEVILRYCRRRIDRTLKQVDFSDAKNIGELESTYSARTADLDISDIAASVEKKIQDAIEAQDLPSLLAVYDNKGLIALAAPILSEKKVSGFKQWLGRLLRNGKHPELVKVIRENLPTIQ